jgi:hypothetical protein
MTPEDEGLSSIGKSVRCFSIGIETFTKSTACVYNLSMVVKTIWLLNENELTRIACRYFWSLSSLFPSSFNYMLKVILCTWSQIVDDIVEKGDDVNSEDKS